MDVGGIRMVASPDDRLLASHLDHGNTGGRGMTTNHGVAVGEALGTAGVTKHAFDVVISHHPDDLASRIEFDDFVTVG